MYMGFLYFWEALIVMISLLGTDGIDWALMIGIAFVFAFVRLRPEYGYAMIEK